MAESNQLSDLSQPPPPPPLPPQSRPSVLQRFIAPLAFNRSQRPQGIQVLPSSSASPKDVSQNRQYQRPPPRSAVYRTGIPIAAIDINDQRTHAVLAGRDILRTVKVQDRAISEKLNIRSAVNSYISTQQLKPDDIHKRREFLPAKDVRWSHGNYSHVVATAAQNGRVALYDVSMLGSSRVELAWLYQHTGQVNKLDFDPHKGYMLLSGSQDRSCKIWDIREPKKPQGYQQYQVRAPVRDVRWSPTDAYEFALCTENGTVQKWDVRRPDQAQLSIPAHEKPCYTIAWHPDGKHLVSGSVDKTLKVWDLKSEAKRQKPVLPPLRCPHGVMNLAWRPACYSAEFAESGSWQSTQIATTYTDDDPRVHIWDFRRPLVPFKELTKFDNRPMDVLWASKEILWTVSGAGIFAQTDVSYAPQVEDSLPPGSSDWAADGSFYAVTEDRSNRRRESIPDPTALFLNVPQARLSGTEGGTLGRNLTDDEGTDTSASGLGRRQSKAVSTRSAKSQANTPPAYEDMPKVLPLDRAVLGQKELFVNGQIGATTRLPGVHVPLPLVAFVANHYSRPSAAQERDADPDYILEKLEKAFLHNGNVCQVAGMSDDARNWRLLAATVMPELREWVDSNRKRRLIGEAAERQAKESRQARGQAADALSPFSNPTSKEKDSKSSARSGKLMTTLFRGVVETERGSSDSGSHGGSNTATPRVHPQFSSPANTKQAGSTWFTLDDTAIEPMQPLPPSLANAHSTAATASRVLFDNASELSSSPRSSPEKSVYLPEKNKSHKRSATESAAPMFGQLVVSKNIAPALKVTTTDGGQTPIMNRNQRGDRRAALRDYKAQTRQPFSLEPPTTSPRYAREQRHDSTESFPMFSASTNSSAKIPSVGRSFEASGHSRISREDSDQWVTIPRDSYYDSIARSDSSEWDSAQRPADESKDSGDSQTVDFTMDDSPRMPLGLSKTTDSKPVQTESIEQRFRNVLERSPKSKEPERALDQDEHPRRNSSSTATSHDNENILPPRKFHHINPFQSAPPPHPPRAVTIEIPPTAPYKPSDFAPIDITTYSPRLPFAWSAYPIISEIIHHDTNHGTNKSQLSAHILAHLIPFFFHPCHRKKLSSADLLTAPENLSDRLMHPAFGARVIEGIFATHITHLRNLHLFNPAAEFEKLCVEEFEFPSLAGTDVIPSKTQQAGEQLKIDPFKIKGTCSTCRTPMPTNSTFCRACATHRERCPICELPLSSSTSTTTNLSSSLVAYCPSCGHSTHKSCLTTWFTLPDISILGICPTPHCNCDCASGLLRDQRIAAQEVSQENESVLRSSVSTSNIRPLRKDSIPVRPSPAVNRARETLRKRGSNGNSSRDRERERTTQSSDERTTMTTATSTPSSGFTAAVLGSASGGSDTAGVLRSAWSKKGTSAGRAGVGGGMMDGEDGGVMARSKSGSAAGSVRPDIGVGSVSTGGSVDVVVGTSVGRRVRVVEPERSLQRK